MRAFDLPPLPASPTRPCAGPIPVPGARAFAFDSRELLGGRREIEIVHGASVYRLRHTRNDKLILVK